MKSGRLRESITIEQKTASRGELGQEIITWTPRAKVFAQLTRQTGSESPKRNFEGDFEEPATFLIRFRSDIASGDRIVHNGKVYSIDKMQPISTTRHQDALELTGVHRVQTR